MVTYVVTVLAKPGHELEVTKFYQGLLPFLEKAQGFRSRRILRARPGTMEAEIRRTYPPEELKGHPEGPEGVQFVIIEEWDSVADRIAFSRGDTKTKNKELFPHLLPSHTHEFYEDVSKA